MKSILSDDLFQFATKLQAEITRAAAGLCATLDDVFEPLHFSMSGHAGTEMTARLTPDELFVKATQGEQSYEVYIPSPHSRSVQPPSVRVSIAGEKETRSFQLGGDAFFAGEFVPPGFKRLHEQVADHVRKTLRWHPETAQAVAKDNAKAMPPKDEADELRTYTLSRTDDMDLRFEGKLIGQVFSAVKGGRSFHFALYQTKGGKYVAARRGLTLVLGEMVRNEVAVCTTPAEVQAFFGKNELAKALYAQMGFEYIQTVD
ncbi:hypothetical protein F6X40_35260 [Paraburkholderia sp. UCT31]|uniref:hypothetical protein n=1 Tax=Paraburkholderia sp. UCT31 TaxID=2615209 RepID=UPI001654C856|nr:hypothetical protein [Paraburkholderia sp. UCT31]MBC8741809.1 hypothetical protein [Paraburkholderia sp. UCT31]